MEKSYDAIKLENQLCFPLYAAAREVVKKYHPYLSELDITYTQYIALMVLWEEKKINVKKLGEILHLDSGTLTPLLKGLEKKGYITRRRDPEDERFLIAEITSEGEILKEKAVEVPYKMSGCINLTAEESMELYRILYKILDSEN